MKQSTSTSFVRGKRVVVTGGAGFIGSNLCEALLAHDNEVVCLDNFVTGHRRNLDSFKSKRGFHLLEGDIRRLDDCKRALDGADYVLHQAALGSVPRSIQDPIASNEYNVNGTLNVFVAARDAKVKRVVYASSSSVYGDSPELPKVEERIGRALSPYAVTKKNNEDYASVFGSLYDMEIIGLRYFNVFGRRQDPDGQYAAAIPKFVKALIKHEAPQIYGDGKQSRDFTYIDNIVELNLLALSTPNKAAVGQVFNGAAGDRTDLNDLVSALIELLSQYDSAIARLKPQHGPVRKGDILHSLASIDKARTLLGYEPKYTVRKGLEECIRWYWETLR